MTERNVKPGESSGVHARAVLGGALAIAFAIVAVALFAWFLLQHWRADPNGANSARPVAIDGPRLQTDARLDLQKYLREKQQRLNSYGWSEGTPRRLHIPIERAMQLLAERQQVPVPGEPGKSGEQQP